MEGVLGLTLRSILAAAGAAAAAAALTKVPLKVLRGEFGRGLEELFSPWRKGKCLDTVCEDAWNRPPLSSSSFHLPLCSPYLRDNEGHWIRNVFLPRLIGGFFLFHPPPTALGET